MMFRTFYLIGWMAIGFVLRAEAQFDNHLQVDSLTYRQYIQKDIKGLQRTGKAALRQGIDFYYLRMRLGVANYNRSNYEAALPHLRRALRMNPNDTIAQEYLYFTYLLSRRDEAAYRIARTWQPTMQQRLRPDLRRFQMAVTLSGGGSFTDNIRANENRDLREMTYPYAEARLNGGMGYGSILLENRLFNRFSLFNYFTIFSTQSLNVVHVGDTLMRSPHRNTHFQYNAALAYTAQGDWTISGAFGYYRVQSNSVIPYYDYMQQQFHLQQKDTIYHGYLGSLSLSKRFPFVQPALGASISNLNGQMQYQCQAALVYYPTGTPYLYGSTSGAYLRNGDQDQFVVSQKLGGRVWKHWWLEAQGSYGNHQNYVSDNGFSVYNTFDPVRWTAGVQSHWFVQRLELSLSYQMRGNKASYYPYSDPNTYFVKNYNYISHLVSGSVRYRF